MSIAQVQRADHTNSTTHIASAMNIHNLCEGIAQKDFQFLSAKRLTQLLEDTEPGFAHGWRAFQESWNRLEQDTFMKDGGTYRFRRHATYSANSGSLCPVLEPHQPHYQSVDYNTLNGGIARHFAPIEASLCENTVLSATLELCCTIFSRLAPYYSWHIEVHQFRIYADANGASPTPEGIHRDGVNFVFMMLVNRVNVINGETGIYDRHKRPLTRYTLANELEAAIVNDERLMHGVTPIIRLDPDLPAYRDVLVITFSKR